MYVNKCLLLFKIRKIWLHEISCIIKEIRRKKRKEKKLWIWYSVGYIEYIVSMNKVIDICLTTDCLTWTNLYIIWI